MRTHGSTADLAKADIAIDAVNVAAPEAGPWYDMRHYKKGCFVVQIGVMETGEELTLGVEECTTHNNALADEQAIAALVRLVEANLECSELQVDVTVFGNGATVEINGVEFTSAALTNVAAREFADAAGLVQCINSVQYGCNGLFAEAALEVVTVFPRPRGSAVITAEFADAGGSAFTMQSNRSICLISFADSDMDYHDFAYVRLTADSGDGIDISGVLLREGYRPHQFYATGL